MIGNVVLIKLSCLLAWFEKAYLLHFNFSFYCGAYAFIRLSTEIEAEF